MVQRTGKTKTVPKLSIEESKISTLSIVVGFRLNKSEMICNKIILIIINNKAGHIDVKHERKPLEIQIESIH